MVVEREKNMSKKSFAVPQLVQHSNKRQKCKEDDSELLVLSFSPVVFCRVEGDWSSAGVHRLAWLSASQGASLQKLWPKWQAISDGARLQWFRNDAGVGQAVATTGMCTMAALVCKRLGPHLQEVPVNALPFENV